MTNKRIVYHGARKNLEFAFKKLSTLSAHSDAITLGVSNRQNTSTVALSEPGVRNGHDPRRVQREHARSEARGHTRNRRGN